MTFHVTYTYMYTYTYYMCMCTYNVHIYNMKTEEDYRRRKDPKGERGEQTDSEGRQ